MLRVKEYKVNSKHLTASMYTYTDTRASNLDLDEGFACVVVPGPHALP